MAAIPAPQARNTQYPKRSRANCRSSSVLPSNSANDTARPVRPRRPLSQVNMRLTSPAPVGVVGQFQCHAGIQIAASRFPGETFDRRVAAGDHNGPAALAGGQFGAWFQAY